MQTNNRFGYVDREDDRKIKKVASAPNHSIAVAMSETEEKAGELSRNFQAKPIKASPKHPDAKEMALSAWSEYFHPADRQKTRSAPKSHNKDIPASITDTGFGHDNTKATANPTERSTSAAEPTNFIETTRTPSPSEINEYNMIACQH